MKFRCGSNSDIDDSAMTVLQTNDAEFFRVVCIISNSSDRQN